jgi:hypothetical protein
LNQGVSGSIRNQDQGWGYQGSLISGSQAPLPPRPGYGSTWGTSGTSGTSGSGMGVSGSLRVPDLPGAQDSSDPILPESSQPGPVARGMRSGLAAASRRLGGSTPSRTASLSWRLRASARGCPGRRGLCSATVTVRRVWMTGPDSGDSDSESGLGPPKLPWRRSVATASAGRRRSLRSKEPGPGHFD